MGSLDLYKVTYPFLVAVALTLAGVPGLYEVTQPYLVAVVSIFRGMRISISSP